MPPYTREDMPLGVLRDRLKYLDENERWLQRKRKAQAAKKGSRSTAPHRGAAHSEVQVPTDVATNRAARRAAAVNGSSDRD